MGTDKEPSRCTAMDAEGSICKGTVPDAHDKSKSHAPIMFTTDLALKLDPEYAKISKRFHENPKSFR